MDLKSKKVIAKFATTSPCLGLVNQPVRFCISLGVLSHVQNLHIPRIAVC